MDWVRGPYKNVKIFKSIANVAKTKKFVNAHHGFYDKDPVDENFNKVWQNASSIPAELVVPEATKKINLWHFG